MLLLVIKEARVTENTQRTDGQDESEVSQAGVPAVPASPALAAPAVPAAPAVATRNQAQPRRYRENPIRQLFPGWKYPTKLGKQDESYFQGYSNDIRALEETAQQHEVCGPAVLAASEKIYDDELARRESINTRCGAVLSTGGILGALFVAASQLGLIQEKGKFGVLAGFLLAAFIIGLVYIGCSITMALAIQGQVKGNVVDPSNISTVDKADINRYQIRLAIKLMNYTVANYRVNNAFKFKLNSAQRCLRNGIIAIIIAGMLSPWTLRTAASNGPSASPSPAANHRIVDPSLTTGWIPSGLQFHAASDDCGCGAPKSTVTIVSLTSALGRLRYLAVLSR
jgi:hypothetical protein